MARHTIPAVHTIVCDGCKLTVSGQALPGKWSTVIAYTVEQKSWQFDYCGSCIHVIRNMLDDKKRAVHDND